MTSQNIYACICIIARTMGEKMKEILDVFPQSYAKKVCTHEHSCNSYDVSNDIHWVWNVEIAIYYIQQTVFLH